MDNDKKRFYRLKSLVDNGYQLKPEEKEGYYKQDWMRSRNYEELQSRSDCEMTIKSIRSNWYRHLIKLQRFQSMGMQLTGNQSRLQEIFNSRKKSFDRYFETKPERDSLSDNDKRQFKMSFFLGQNTGKESYTLAWKKSKNYERSMRPDQNGFVKGFVQSQWRSHQTKLLQFQLEADRLTGGSSRQKEISERIKKLYHRDMESALEKYRIEKKIEQKSRIKQSGFREKIPHTKIGMPFKRKMKIKNREMDRDR